MNVKQPPPIVFRPLQGADLFAPSDNVTSAAKRAIAELAPGFGAIGTGIVVVDVDGYELTPARAVMTATVCQTGELAATGGWLSHALGSLLFVSVESVDHVRIEDTDLQAYVDGPTLYDGTLYVVPLSRLRRYAQVWGEQADDDLGRSLRSPRWLVRQGAQGAYSVALTVPVELLAAAAQWQGPIGFEVAQ